MKSESWVINGVAILAPHGKLMGGPDTTDLDIRLSDTVPSVLFSISAIRAGSIRPAWES